ncbi:hypothetical protein COT47_03505 [Candidatus Woesearchaeota archaeon CG08_land_8_20_14_0_20_43_7]|nr:MAG: hypothetical protein COT47_03505 [Candidatus Woesearchaeota archaeon CG08_land_8_20_14_0_20_43_7]
MDSLQTIVNKKQLEGWCKLLPDCETFLENFFCSCKPYGLETNLLNYVHDIKSQIAIDPTWQEYKNPLMQAFFDIIGYDGQ